MDRKLLHMMFTHIKQYKIVLVTLAAVVISVLLCLTNFLPKRQKLTTTSSEWVFRDAPNTAVFTTSEVINDHLDVVYVYHDLDGAWQFFSNNNPNIKKAKVVGLSEMVDLDNSINEIFDLPLGWSAYRESKLSPWKRTKTN